MKKLMYILTLTALALLVTSCGSFRSLDINRLTTGMTKAQVEEMAGPPQRVLAVNNTKDGYQEVLEYSTARNEVYALEFWNDYLTGYEYLYDDIQYVPAPAPPMYIPPYGRPIIIVNERPGRPGYSQSQRPQSRPQSRPQPPRSTGRTSESSRPSSSSSSSSSSSPSSSSGRYSSGSTSTSSSSNTNSNRSTSTSSSSSSSSSNSNESNNSRSTGRSSSGR